MVGWGPLPDSSVMEQSAAYEKAQEDAEMTSQRVLNLAENGAFLKSKLCIYMPAIDRPISVIAGGGEPDGGVVLSVGGITAVLGGGGGGGGEQRSARAERMHRAAKEEEEAWVGWRRVGKTLWVRQGVPGAAQSHRRVLREGELSGKMTKHSMQKMLGGKKKIGVVFDSFKEHGAQRDDGWKFVEGEGWSFAGDFEEPAFGVYDRGIAITRGWGALSNVEREAATLLGWETASWIARDAAPLAEMGLHGLTLDQAQATLRIDTEEVRLLKLLGFPEDHAFAVYRNDSQAPGWMHRTQVFVTVKHSKARVSESVIPQFEDEGHEKAFQTRPKEGQLSPQRSGAMWQQGYLSSVTGQCVLHDHLSDPRLWDAASHGELGELRRLLRSGTDPDMRQPSSGQTALQLAVRHNQAGCVEILARAGADLNAVDNEGNTALHLCRSKEVASLLLRHGKHLGTGMLNKAGETAFAYLMQRFPAVAEQVKPRLTATHRTWVPGGVPTTATAWSSVVNTAAGS